MSDESALLKLALADAELAADSFREERDETRAEVAKLRAEIEQLRVASAVTTNKPVETGGSAASYPPYVSEFLSYFRREPRNRQAWIAARVLLVGFLWRETEDSHDYWNDIHDKLVGLGEGEGWAE